MISAVEIQVFGWGVVVNINTFGVTASHRNENYINIRENYINIREKMILTFKKNYIIYKGHLT